MHQQEGGEAFSQQTWNQCCHKHCCSGWLSLSEWQQDEWPSTTAVKQQPRVIALSSRRGQRFVLGSPHGPWHAHGGDDDDAAHLASSAAASRANTSLPTPPQASLPTPAAAFARTEGRARTNVCALPPPPLLTRMHTLRQGVRVGHLSGMVFRLPSSSTASSSSSFSGVSSPSSSPTPPAWSRVAVAGGGAGADSGHEVQSRRRAVLQRVWPHLPVGGQFAPDTAASGIFVDRQQHQQGNVRQIGEGVGVGGVGVGEVQRQHPTNNGPHNIEFTGDGDQSGVVGDNRSMWGSASTIRLPPFRRDMSPQ